MTRSNVKKNNVKKKIVLLPLSAAVFLGVFAVGPILSSAPANAADPVIGREIAEKWCASCHLVAPGGKAADAAPSFVAMANDPSYTESRLRGWLFEPHPPMPRIELTKDQTDAIIAYIQSLKRP